MKTKSLLLKSLVLALPFCGGLSLTYAEPELDTVVDVYEESHDAAASCASVHRLREKYEVLKGATDDLKSYMDRYQPAEVMHILSMANTGDPASNTAEEGTLNYYTGEWNSYVGKCGEVDYDENFAALFDVMNGGVDLCMTDEDADCNGFHTTLLGAAEMMDEYLGNALTKFTGVDYDDERCCANVLNDMFELHVEESEAPADDVETEVPADDVGADDDVVPVDAAIVDETALAEEIVSGDDSAVEDEPAAAEESVAVEEPVVTEEPVAIEEPAA